MRSISTMLILGLCMTVWAAAGCGKAKPTAAEVSRPPVAGVTTAVVQKTKTVSYYETSGTMKALSVSAISAKVMGTVTQVLVQEGEQVSAGQVLATLEDSDLTARTAAAQAAYQEALKGVAVAEEQAKLDEVTHQRYLQLYQEKAIARQEMDQKATKRTVSDLELDKARAGASRAAAEVQVYRTMTRITAPTKGIVTAKKIDLGSTATPGVPLFVVEDTSAFTFEVDIDESLAGVLRTGMTGDILISGANKPLAGIITEVAPAVDPAARKFRVKLSVAGEGLKSGLYGKLRLPIGSREAIFVPAAAVVTKGQLTGVYVVNEAHIITYRLVRLGTTDKGIVEILSGLSEGERVIIAGVEKAVDGGKLNEVKMP